MRLEIIVLCVFAVRLMLLVIPISLSGLPLNAVNNFFVGYHRINRVYSEYGRPRARFICFSVSNKGGEEK